MRPNRRSIADRRYSHGPMDSPTAETPARSTPRRLLQSWLPVVVSDRGALPERVKGRGVIVSVEDETELFNVIQSFRDQPERLAALRAAPRPRLSSLTLHEATLREHYREVLRNASGGGA